MNPPVFTLAGFWNGTRDTAPVALLPREACLWSHSKRPDVYVNRRTVNKIKRDHPDITEGEFMMVPAIFELGLLLGEVKKSNKSILGIYKSGDYELKAVVKIYSPYQAYLQTLHRLAPRQTKTLMRRADSIIRTHM